MSEPIDKGRSLHSHFPHVMKTVLEETTVRPAKDMVTTAVTAVMTSMTMTLCPSNFRILYLVRLMIGEEKFIDSQVSGTARLPL